jgi:hypothetical protein
MGIIEAGRDAGAGNYLVGSYEIQGFIRRDSQHKKLIHVYFIHFNIL